MKRCPQCNTVFEDNQVFCTHDGTSLIDEAFPLPSDFTPEDNDEDEQETVVRYNPIKIDISDSKTSKPQTQVKNETPTGQPQLNQYAPNHGNGQQLTTQESGGGCLKYTAILLIGLLVGGGIVLAALGIGYVYMNSPEDENQNASVEKTVKETPFEESNNNSTKKSVNTHSEKKADVIENNLNGRIIRNRATLRSSPSNTAKRIDRLPKNDRIEIIRRKSASSKWYEIECEHGVKGWIDGYLIEFSQ